MKVPLSWLQEFFDQPLPPVADLVNVMDGLGLAVEQVIQLDGAPAGVVAVDVVEVEPIEGSDNLKRTVVTDGNRQYQVVCGAPNVVVGMRTALALPGAVLPAAAKAAAGEATAVQQLGTDTAGGGQVGGLLVGEKQIMGMDSTGMLCSPRELGLYDHAAGLIAFGDDVSVGASLADLWAAETVIELELTPNRADAFSLLGVARDVAAKLGVEYKHPAVGLDQGRPFVLGQAAGGAVEQHAGAEEAAVLFVQVEDQACTRFTLRGIHGVQVRPSPVFMQRWLAAVGLRPRNNLIDITNFVTFELGGPSHVYDLAKLGGGVVQVRRAVAGEKLELLNDDVIDLVPEDLLIATPGPDGGSMPIGLAGVMGGKHDSVSSTTTDVALEVAGFDPVVVRRAGQRHKLITDARTRFERGVDPNLQLLVSARVASLIEELAGGKADVSVTVYGSDFQRPAIAYRPSRVQFLMDFDVPLEQQRVYLEALGCTVLVQSEDSWSVTPPSWRYDMSIEEDVVEEVARLHGYENIGITVPDMHFVPVASDPTHRELKNRLAAVGMQETISYVFTGQAELERAKAPEPVVFLSDPQGIERGVLRTALYPGLLAAAAANRRTGALSLFEVGRVFLDTEQERVALLTIGPRQANGWGTTLAGDFYTFKGLIEALGAPVGAVVTMESVAEPAADAPYLHPGVAASVLWNGQHVGYAGRLHPEIAAAYELSETYVAELGLPLGGTTIRFQEIVRQPYAERDLAIIAPVSVTFGSLAQLCADAAGSLLLSLQPFDVFEGGRLEAGTRSTALRFRFRADDRALTDVEVDEVMQNVTKAVREAGYDVRA